jgi:hypothetical protein
MKIKIIWKHCSWKMLLGQFFKEIFKFALLIAPELIFAPRFKIFLMKFREFFSFQSKNVQILLELVQRFRRKVKLESSKTEKKSMNTTDR